MNSCERANRDAASQRSSQRRGDAVPAGTVLDTSEASDRQAVFAHALDKWSSEHEWMTNTPRRSGMLTRNRRWLMPLLTIFLLAVGGAGYLHVTGTSSVSAAQVILRHAASAMGTVPLNQAQHAVYTITTLGNQVSAPPATIDEWVVRDGSGLIAKGAISCYDRRGNLQSRTIIDGPSATTYDAATNMILQGTVDRDSLPNPLETATVARLVQMAQQGSDQTERLLPRQSIDGHTVIVVAVDRDLPMGGDVSSGQQAMTFYIDEQTYLVRGVDIQQSAATGAVVSATRMRLSQYTTIPTATLAAATFTLNAPSTAHAAVAPDGGTQMGTQPLSVSQAVALLDRPAPLLSSPVDGLQLQGVTLTRLPTLSEVDYLYADSTGHTIFAINSAVGDAAMIPWPRSGSLAARQQLPLSIAGQMATASYYSPSANAYALLYTQGAATVRVIGEHMDKITFFRAINALIDGHLHTGVVAQLQQRLGAKRAGTP